MNNLTENLNQALLGNLDLEEISDLNNCNIEDIKNILTEDFDQKRLKSVVFNFILDTVKNASVLDSDKFDEMFDSQLDSCYPSAKIGYLEFNASTILKDCDPIAYRIAKQESFENFISDLKFEIENKEFDQVIHYFDYLQPATELYNNL